MILLLRAGFGFVAASGLLLLMIRLLRRKSIICQCFCSPGKHVVITGATSGIGRSAAFALAERKCKLTLGCRDLSAADEVKREIIATVGNTEINVKHLDLTDRSSIDHFWGDIPKVDALINNAGVMTSSPGSVSAFGGVTVNVATNYLGTVYLTQRFLQHINPRSEGVTSCPRVILVSSALASRGRLDGLLQPSKPESPSNATQAYSDSKLALCLYAKELHRRFGCGVNKRLDVYCLFTGGMVDTRLNRHRLSEYPIILQWLWKLLSRNLLKTPFEGCQSLVHCAISGDVFGAHVHTTSQSNRSENSGGGLLYRNCVPIPWPDKMNDIQQAQLLWTETMQLLNISE